LKFLVPILLGGVGIAVLTMQAFSDDAHDKEYQAAVAKSHLRAQRAIELAKQGIPPGGPLVMLSNDPMSYGADLYAQHCQSCHVLDGEGDREAPEHTGYGSRAWVLGLLNDPHGDKYFGPTEIDDMKSMSKLGEPTLKAITEFLYSLGHEPKDKETIDTALALQGQEAFKEKCLDCHMYQGDGDFNGIGGPDLTGYGSRAWIRKQVENPQSIYGELNDMPTFADDLSAHDLDMVVAFLRKQRFK
jgi:mono/diheme cytochrome c family protein